MANVIERAGSVYLRWGGNTQEYAKLVQQSELDNHRTFGKEKSGTTATVSSPLALLVFD